MQEELFQNIRDEEFELYVAEGCVVSTEDDIFVEKHQACVFNGLVGGFK